MGQSFAPWRWNSSASVTGRRRSRRGANPRRGSLGQDCADRQRRRRSPPSAGPAGSRSTSSVTSSSAAARPRPAAPRRASPAAKRVLAAETFDLEDLPALARCASTVCRASSSPSRRTRISLADRLDVGQQVGREDDAQSLVAARSATSSRIATRPPGSRPLVGSSSSSHCGSCTRAVRQLQALPHALAVVLAGAVALVAQADEVQHLVRTLHGIATRACRASSPM